MTSYSVLKSATKFTVIATWTGGWEDHSATVTSFTHPEQAARLAFLLTRISEDAWDAAGFLDTTAVLESAIDDLITQLRGAAAELTPIRLDPQAFRHIDEWSYTDFRDLLTEDLIDVVKFLSRAQRLSVADELTADSASRAAALRLLPTGHDPDDDASRIWQMGEVTRSFRNGQTGLSLPESAASWIVRCWGIEHSPARRWACRDRLVRIEQLVAACNAYGGRGREHDDPLVAHVVIPHAGPYEDDQVIYVGVKATKGEPWPDPFSLMTIRSSRGGESLTLGELDPGDDDGFARLLGDWTRLVPYRP